MLKLKRWKNDADKAKQECVCGGAEGGSSMIGCSEKNCPQPWWHPECAGIKGLSQNSIKKMEFTCSICIINRFHTKFEPIANSNGVTPEQLGQEIEKEITKCVPKIVKEISEILCSTHPSTENIKEDMKKSFVEIIKEQSEDTSKIRSIPSTVTKNIVKEALREGKTEQDKLDKRKRSLIIFEAEEPNEIGGDQAKTKDEKFFKTLCHHVDDRILENEEEIVDIKRMGKKRDEKRRPIIVTLKTEKAKRLLFGNLYKLKEIDEWKELKFNHDMTDEERKARKEKVKEAKEKTDALRNNTSLSHDAKNWLFVVRGPPWDQRLVKKRPLSRQQEY